VDNYVEPFAGSLAVLLARPHPPGTETVNDLDCYVANFWRALQSAPAAVIEAADWPVNEADLHARHGWLLAQTDFRERMLTEPEFFDARVAGWWAWGLSSWIGGGWCSPDRTGSRQVPRIDAMCDTKLNNVGSSERESWLYGLAHRLRRVRVVCGEWHRVLGPTPLGLTSNVPPGFRTAVLLDPPYSASLRSRGCFAHDGSESLPADVRSWAIAHGADPRLRIALCGYDGEHDMPTGWQCVAWKARGGYGSRTGNLNAWRERVWFSPHCLRPDESPELFRFP
jgi:DNA adenine methylase